MEQMTCWTHDASLKYKKPYFSTRGAVTLNSGCSHPNLVLPNQSAPCVASVGHDYCCLCLLQLMDLPAVYERLSDHLVKTEQGLNGWGKHGRSLFGFSGLLWPSEVPLRPTLPRLQSPQYVRDFLIVVLFVSCVL